MESLSLSFLMFVLGSVVTAIIARSIPKKYVIPAVPSVSISDAQHAANQAQQDFLVIYDGNGFLLAKASNMFAYNGIVVHVAHPEAI